MGEQKDKLPIEDLLLVADKLQGEAQRAQLKLIQFLIERGVYRWGRPVDWNNQVIRDVCAEFGWESYAGPLTQGTGQPPKDQLSKTEALRELRERGHQTAECLFSHLVDPKHMPRSDNQGAAVKEYWSGQWVELLLRKGHKLEDAIEQVAAAQERLPIRVRTEWEKFRNKREY